MIFYSQKVRKREKQRLSQTSTHNINYRSTCIVKFINHRRSSIEILLILESLRIPILYRVHQLSSSQLIPTNINYIISIEIKYYLFLLKSRCIYDFNVNLSELINTCIIN